MRRREKCFTTLQSGHLLYHAKANNGQAGVGFLLVEPRVAELVLCITKRYKLYIVQVYAPTTSYSEEDINIFYNDVDETLREPNHYTIVIGDFNAQIGKRIILWKRQRANLDSNLKMKETTCWYNGQHEESTKS